MFSSLRPWTSCRSTRLREWFIGIPPLTAAPVPQCPMPRGMCPDRHPSLRGEPSTASSDHFFARNHFSWLIECPPWSFFRCKALSSPSQLVPDSALPPWATAILRTQLLQYSFTGAGGSLDLTSGHGFGQGFLVFRAGGQSTSTRTSTTHPQPLNRVGLMYCMHMAQ